MFLSEMHFFEPGVHGSEEHNGYWYGLGPLPHFRGNHHCSTTDHHSPLEFTKSIFLRLPFNTDHNTCHHSSLTDQGDRAWEIVPQVFKATNWQSQLFWHKIPPCFHWETSALIPWLGPSEPHTVQPCEGRSSVSGPLQFSFHSIETGRAPASRRLPHPTAVFILLSWSLLASASLKTVYSAWHLFHACEFDKACPHLSSPLNFFKWY